jgi:hypothetical protein
MAVLRGLLETGLAYGNTWIFKEVVEAFTRSDATGQAAKALLVAVAAVTALDEDDGECARTCMNEAGSEPEVRSTCCSGAWVQRRDALPARTRAGAHEARDSGSHRLRAQAPRGGVRSAAQEVLAALRSARVCASSMYGACSVCFVFFYICICGSRVAVRTPHAVQRPKFRQLLVSLVSATSKTTSTSRSGFGLWSTRCMEPTRRRKSRTRRPQSPRRSCVRCAHQWLVYWDWFGFHLLWIVDLAEIAVYIMDAHFAQCTYHLQCVGRFWSLQRHA